MSELLRTANDTSLSEPWPRVHACNVLRLAFNDKNLSTDSSGFFAEGTSWYFHELCDPKMMQAHASITLYHEIMACTLVGRKQRNIEACHAGIAAAIGGMSASEWEIRNSASLTFTSLVVRTVGFKNVLKVHLSTRPQHHMLLGFLVHVAVTPQLKGSIPSTNVTCRVRRPRGPLQGRSSSTDSPCCTPTCWSSSLRQPRRCSHPARSCTLPCTPSLSC